MTRPQIKITKEQWIQLQSFTRSNVLMILTMLEDDLGFPIEPNYPRKENSPVYLALYSHAVEEYGKLLYLKSLTPDESNMITIDYDGDHKQIPNTFKNHKVKFGKAIEELPKTLTTFHNGNFGKDFVGSDYDTDIISDWETRLNILNTDIDENGDGTKIPLIDLDTLRSAVFEFKNLILGDRNST